MEKITMKLIVLKPQVDFNRMKTKLKINFVETSSYKNGFMEFNFIPKWTSEL